MASSAQNVLKKDENYYLLKKNPLSIFSRYDSILVYKDSKIFQVRGNPDGLKYNIKPNRHKGKLMLYGRSKSTTHSQNFVRTSINNLNKQFKYNTRHLDYRLTSFVELLLFGRNSYNSANLKYTFQEIGIIHLLVVSGFHCAIIYLLIKLFIVGILRVFYSLHLISSEIFVNLHIASIAVSLILSFITIVICGFGDSAQRAIILLWLLELKNLGVVNCTKLSILGLCATLQILISPIGFISISTILSWSAYLIVSHSFKLNPLKRAIFRETMILCLVFILLKKVNLISLVINPLIVAIFPFLAIIAIVVVLFNNVIGSTIIINFTNYLFNIFEILAKYSTYTTVSLTNTPHSHIIYNILLLVLISVLVLIATKINLKKDLKNII